MKKALTLLTALLLTSCNGGDDPKWFPYDDGGTGTDSDVDSDVDTSTETDTVTDTEDTDTSTEDTETETETEDTETETETTDTDDGCTASGNWYDADTTLCWQQDPIDAATLSWSDAMTYCEDLDVAGHDDWRLPSVGELRSIVRGCSGNETGGTCAVTDSCLSAASCWSDATCPACPSLAGPDDGCYWVDWLGGSCSLSWYWTSSSVADYSGYAWEIAFNIGGRTGAVVKATLMAARCVRGG